MNVRRFWTQEEIDYLVENYGNISTKAIAKNLGCDVQRVQNKAKRMRLNFTDNTGYITLGMLACSFGVPNHFVRRFWVTKGMPVKSKLIVERRIAYVDMNEFWKWAEKHKATINFSKLRKYDLGYEPEWVDIQRRRDYQNKHNYKDDKKWNFIDTDRLKRYAVSGKYTISELADLFQRTEVAIERKLRREGVKPNYKPKERVYLKGEKWNMLLELIAQGYKLPDVVRRFDARQKTITDKLRREFGTSDFGKIREVLTNG